MARTTYLLAALAVLAGMSFAPRGYAQTPDLAAIECQATVNRLFDGRRRLKRAISERPDANPQTHERRSRGRSPQAGAFARRDDRAQYRVDAGSR